MTIYTILRFCLMILPILLYYDYVGSYEFTIVLTTLIFSEILVLTRFNYVMF